MGFRGDRFAVWGGRVRVGSGWSDESGVKVLYLVLGSADLLHQIVLEGNIWNKGGSSSSLFDRSKIAGKIPEGADILRYDYLSALKFFRKVILGLGLFGMIWQCLKDFRKSQSGAERKFEFVCVSNIISRMHSRNWDSFVEVLLYFDNCLGGHFREDKPFRGSLRCFEKCQRDRIFLRSHYVRSYKSL